MENVCGIILAGGAGTRLFPLTRAISKQLLPVYDKPMIYYPLAVLMAAGIRDILVITTPEQQRLFINTLGYGVQLGITIRYAVQPEPKGIADALTIGEEFIGNRAVCLILGDNLFYTPRLSKTLRTVCEHRTETEGGTIFTSRVNDPSRYGVVEFEKKTNRIVSIEEKPKKPKSKYVATGLYVYHHESAKRHKDLSPSARGELEITDLNTILLDRGELDAVKLPRGSVWFDAGTHDSLLESAHFVKSIEAREGVKIGCIEEIAYRNGFIDDDLFETLIDSSYGDYQTYLRGVRDD